MTRVRWRPGPPLLALAAGWVALFAWGGMLAEPSGFLTSTLLVGLLMALAGSALRVARVPAYAVALVQVLLALLSLNVLYAARESLLAVIPTEDSVRHLISVIGNGAATLNHYAAPVEVNPTHTRAMLVVCGLAVLFSVDVLAFGLRRPPLIALPLLGTLSVPVSILNDALALPVFVGTSLLFLRLLAIENLDTFRGWGDRARATPSSATRAGSTNASWPVATTLWQVSIAAVLVALIAAPLVPVADLLDRSPGGEGNGTGTGGRFQLTAVNPMIRLRRDLVEQTHTPLVYAETRSPSTSYLRTTVLDEFTSDSWRPSDRDLPSENQADGGFPSPPGLAPGLSGAAQTWELQLAPAFSTIWLPLPYPIRELDVPGSWRYDERTLDVAYVSGRAEGPLSYRATAFTPRITAQLLESTVRAPRSVRAPMTKVPRDLPDVISTRAREITQGADSDFEKAVAIQSWFRQDGGFQYSLKQRSGSGMDLLAAFVTEDRIGYCEQFAAAMAAMGRTLDIPSRVVVGFLDGETQQDGRILYTSDDRHAWPEMYFTGVGWVRFEPTPGQRTGASPSWTRQDVATAQPSTAPSAAASPAPEKQHKQTPAEDRAGQDQGFSVTRWQVLSLLVVLVLALGPGLVRRSQRRRRLASSDPVHFAEGAWAELRATALDLGLNWPEVRSPREQARSVQDQVKAQDEDVQALESLLVRVELGRYGPGGGVDTVDAEVRSRTVETVSAWRRAMAGSVDRGPSWRSRVWPVSVLRRR
jgi:transglutaminase-like putative cysteine protease